MFEAKLIYSTPEGSQEIPIPDGGKLTFGRGSEAGMRFDDEGLSRLNSTVYREGERVWIVDENSTNGTFVGGKKVSGSGTPLKDGDTIKIGNRTNLRVNIGDTQFAKSVSTPISQKSLTVSAVDRKRQILPLAVIAGAIFMIGFSAIFIGWAYFSKNRLEVAYRDDADSEDNRPVREIKENSPTPTPSPGKSTGTYGDSNSPYSYGSNNNNSNSGTISSSGADNPLASGTNDTTGSSGGTPYSTNGKKYLEMNDAERRLYLEVKAMRIAQIIGNNSSDRIPPEAITKIKGFADAYASRSKVKPLGGCRFGDNLQATYERAAKDAPFINRAFNEKGIDPRIGLYLAMIESEHCVCLQSPTGPLGMFQFTFATAKLHFVPPEGVRKGASPASPDDRCFPEPAAKAAASYMKALTGRYGTGPSSVPLAIGSYNSGEGGLSTNLQKALESGTGLPRDFWTLISKGEILSKQFQSENFKYVPKFFAAAIIGENPQDFGLELQPVSTYTK